MGSSGCLCAALALFMVAIVCAQDDSCAQSKKFDACSEDSTNDRGVILKVAFEGDFWSCDYLDEDHADTEALIDALETALEGVHGSRNWYDDITICEISAGSLFVQYEVNTVSSLTPLQMTQTGLDLAMAANDGDLEITIGGTTYLAAPGSQVAILPSGGDPEEVEMTDECYYYDTVDQCGSGSCFVDNGGPACDCPDGYDLPYCGGDETNVLLAVLIALAVIAVVIIILLIVICCHRWRKTSRDSSDQQKLAQQYHHGDMPYTGVMGGTLMPHNTMNNQTMNRQQANYNPGYAGAPTTVAMLQPLRYGGTKGRGPAPSYIHSNRMIHTSTMPKQAMSFPSPASRHGEIGGDIYRIVDTKGGQTTWHRV